MTFTDLKNIPYSSAHPYVIRRVIDGYNPHFYVRRFSMLYLFTQHGKGKWTVYNLSEGVNTTQLQYIVNEPSFNLIRSSAAPYGLTDNEVNSLILDTF